MQRFLILLLGCACLCTRGLSTDSVTVSASSALRVAWVEPAVGTAREAKTPLQRTFGPVFRVALEGIYGADTTVEFLPMSAPRAAERMARGQVDAVVQFGARVAGPLRRSGGHVLRAESITRPGRYVAFLVLPDAQPRLEELLANAFSASINHFDVRRTLNDAPVSTDVAGW